MAITQAGRFLTVKTPLGEDELILTAMDGQESMSGLFAYQLEMVSENDSIAADDIVGKNVTFTVQGDSDSPRIFNGICSRFYAGGRRGARGEELRIYRAEISPWLWFLTRTADCRIFQNKTAVDIIKEVFDDNGFSDYSVAGVKRELSEYVYKVQYRETDFNFVSRLMEDEGIFYYFKHEDGKHTMEIADKKESYYKVEDSSVEVGMAAARFTQIDRLNHRYEFVPGKWAQRDYNFEDSGTDLTCEESSILGTPNIDNFEVYDYPGLYMHKRAGKPNSGGSDLTKIRMEEEEARYHVVDGSGNCPSFSPGGKFSIKKHDIASEIGESYAITHVGHSGTDYSYISDGSGAPAYSNSFVCIPSDVVYRPKRTTRKPIVEGPQTAVVVGPSGEEIDCDKYGRIKVQFHWDRYGSNDEKSSCDIRVAQMLAGSKWGSVFTPRMGMEVIVSFLEGDPDQPMVTGCVYNDVNMPPYELPSNKTQSGIKSRSSKEGGTDNFNELRFEDKKDEEEVYFHAEKDFNRVVENNDTLKVGFDKMDPGDQTIEIYNNRTETVDQGDETVTIKTGNRLVDIDTGNETLNVKTGNRETKVDTGNNTLTVAIGNRTTEVSLGKDSLEAMQSIELKCGASSIKLEPAQITIKSVMVNIQGDAMLEAKSPMTTVKGDAMLTLKGGITMIN